MLETGHILVSKSTHSRLAGATATTKTWGSVDSIDMLQPFPTLTTHKGMSSRPTGPKKGRLGSGKSTSGCITCKIRKVKCDEQKPSCQRCLGTGRRCDGYQTKSSPSRPPFSTRAHQIDTLPVYGSTDHREIQAFEYFVFRVIPGFTRIVDGDLWHRILPQLTHTEPSLWLAVIAMACLIQFPQYSAAPMPPASSRASTSVSNENHRRALRWYGQSIASLRDRIKTERSHSSVAIVACMLYMCIECLQDHVVEAVVLYRHAVGMVGLATPDNRERSSITELETRLDCKIRALLRHETMSHGLPVPRPKLVLDSNSGSFQELADAREELYALITETQAFIQHVVRIKQMHGKDWPAPPNLIAQQEYHQTDLLRWHGAFSSTTSSPGAVNSPNEIELRSVLLVVYTQYFIWLSVCLSTFETAFDGFFLYFESMVRHAERVIASTAPETRPVFLLESRVIPSLYFVAIKCRHPWIRRRALFLLRNGPRVENIWKAEPMAVVAERSIEVEESGAIHSGLDQVQAQHLRTDNLPPECNRLYQQEVIDLKDTNGHTSHQLVLCGWRQDEDLQWSRTSLSLKINSL